MDVEGPLPPQKYSRLCPSLYDVSVLVDQSSFIQFQTQVSVGLDDLYTGLLDRHWPQVGFGPPEVYHHLFGFGGVNMQVVRLVPFHKVLHQAPVCGTALSCV